MERFCSLINSFWRTALTVRHKVFIIVCLCSTYSFFFTHNFFHCSSHGLRNCLHVNISALDKKKYKNILLGNTMREKLKFVCGVLMFICGIFGSGVSLFYLGYPLISFHVLIGGVIIYYGLKWMDDSFSSEEEKEERKD